MSIEVTGVRINKVNSDKCLAYAQVTINDGICIRDIRLLNGKNGRFIGMPSKKGTDGKYRDYVFPINSDVRKLLTEAIIKEYEEKEDPFDGK